MVTINFEEETDEELEAHVLTDLSETKQKELKKEKHKRKVNKFIEYIKSNYYPKTIMGTKEDLYLYKDGYYSLFGESLLKTLCDKEFGNSNSGSLYGDILHRIKSSKMIERELFTEFPNRINLQNGVLNVFSNTIEPHSPDFNFLYRIEREYYPDKYKDCPTIKKFLMDICENDENKYWLLVEFFGFILISEYKIKKFLCIFGDGNNGKTTLANLMTEFINKKNTSQLSMVQITEHEFLTSDLYGMKLNIKGEKIPNKINSLEILKSLTGNDPQQVNRKFKDTLKFINTAKFVFHFNKLPQFNLKNLDDAGLERIMLLQLNHNFVKGGEEDKNLLDKLTTKDEMEGLLYLAIEGLKRLRDNRKFTYNDSTTFDMLLDNQFNSNEEFIEKHFICGNEYLIPCHDALKVFNSNGNKPISITELTKIILSYDNHITIKQRGKVGEQVRCYIGIKEKQT